MLERCINTTAAAISAAHDGQARVSIKNLHGDWEADRAQNGSERYPPGERHRDYKQHERHQKDAPVEKYQHSRTDQHAFAPAEPEIHWEHMAENDENPGHQLAHHTGEHTADGECRGRLGDVAEQHEQRLSPAPIVR